MTRRPNTHVSFLLFLGLCTMAAPAHTASAGPVTWAFEGVVETVFDENDVLGGAVQPGSLIAGSITVESTTAGDGSYRDPFTDVTGSLEGFSFSGPISDRGRIYITNDYDSGTYQKDVMSLFAPVSFLNSDALLSFDLTDPTATIFDSRALPILPPDLSSIPEDLAYISLFRETEDLSIRGRLTSLVPEPGTLVLFVLAGVVIGLRRRRCAQRLSTSSHLPLMFMFLIAGVTIACASAAVADDCNGNGLNDATELSDCPTVGSTSTTSTNSWLRWPDRSRR